jgi:acyl carrier protein
MSSRLEITSRLQDICQQIFGHDIVITEETSANNIESWDSMTHVVLIATIEKEFDITFDIMEIISIATIGDFIDLIDKKLN